MEILDIIQVFFKFGHFYWAHVNIWFYLIIISSKFVYNMVFFFRWQKLTEVETDPWVFPLGLRRALWVGQACCSLSLPTWRHMCTWLHCCTPVRSRQELMKRWGRKLLILQVYFGETFSLGTIPSSHLFCTMSSKKQKKKRFLLVTLLGCFTNKTHTSHFAEMHI